MAFKTDVDRELLVIQKTPSKKINVSYIEFSGKAYYSIRELQKNPGSEDYKFTTKGYMIPKEHVKEVIDAISGDLNGST